MITGDNPLTACHVAKELHFTRKTLLVLTAPTKGKYLIRQRRSTVVLLFISCAFVEATEWQWETVNKDIVLPLQPKNMREFTREYDLCVTGEVRNI